MRPERLRPEWIRQGAPGGGQPAEGPGIVALAELGERLALTIVVNELERDGDRLFSTSMVLAGGTMRSRHRKTHVTIAEEDAGLSAGDTAAAVVSVAGLPVPVAPMVCFEHGFPEIALRLAREGAGVMAISSAIRTGFEYLRDLRTRARAQDNGAYVVAANAVGRGFCGQSMIVDPRGDVVARASAEAADVIVATVDADLISEQRRQEPVIARRRPELYG